MKNLSLTFCLAIAALFGSVGSGFASNHLPKCSGSPITVKDTPAMMQKLYSWSNCLAHVTAPGVGNYSGEVKNGFLNGFGSMSYYRDKIYYVGMWQNHKKNGVGILIDYEGNITEGIWKDDKLLRSQKTSLNGMFDDLPITEFMDLWGQQKPVPKTSLLRTAFVKLSKAQRKQLQSNLKDLGFYKSSIDGLFGKGTAGALTAYNKQNLNGADLKKSQNVEKLFNVVLGLKPSPKPNSKPKRDLEKEFGLSLYGSLVHSEKVPNALFFFDNIEQNDSFEFRKALRNHDVDLIVLSSPGGSVWEGLQIAGIINDKGLSVYVPKSGGKGDGNCASACSFMFFAGATRQVEGKLGVHQFLSKKNKKREEIGKTQKTAQFTVSEIIGFLNEFETPAWVFERMFQQSEMYYFKETELVQLETEVSDELVAHYEKSETFISDFARALAEVSE